MVVLISNETELNNWLSSAITDDAHATTDFAITSNLSGTNTIGSGRYFDGFGFTITVSVSSFNGIFPMAGGTVRSLKVITSSGFSSASSQAVLMRATGDLPYGNVDRVTVDLDLNGHTLSTAGFCYQSNTVQMTFTQCVFKGRAIGVGGSGFVGHCNNQNHIFQNCVSSCTSTSGSGNVASCYINGVSTSNGSGNFSGCIAYTRTVSNSSFSGFIGRARGTNTFNSCYYYCSYNNSGSAFFQTDDAFTQVFYNQGNYAYVQDITKGTLYITTSTTNAVVLNDSFALLSNGPTANFAPTIASGGEFNTSWSGTGTSSQFQTGGSYPFNVGVAPPILSNFSSSPWTGYSGANNIPSLDYSVICIVKGTLIRTPTGEVAVENLRVGDIIETGSGPLPVKSLFSRSFIGNENLVPRKIPAHKYGEGMPHTDLYVSQWHALYIDGKFHHTRCLGYEPETSYYNNVFEYYHVGVEKYPEVMYANGMPVETSGFKFRPHVYEECGPEECKIMVRDL